MHRPDRNNWCALAVILIIVFSGCALALNAQPKPKVRTIPAYAGVPIVDRLLPDDELVVITRDYDLVHAEPEPTVEQWIDEAIRTADTVAVVELREVGGILVDNGTWIHTKLSGIARDVLKTSADRRISAEDTIELELVGGEMTFGKVRVQTNESMTFLTNRQYVMFLDVQGTTLAMGYAPLLIENERLIGIHNGGAAMNKLHAATLSDVRRRVLVGSKRR